MLTEEARLRIKHSFPAVVWPDVDVVSSHLETLYPEPTWTLSPDCIGPIVLNGEQLSIPFRVYLREPEPDRISALSSFQQLILSAILSRSSDGYVREKNARELLQSDEPWIPPFVLQLLGEYVLPIIRVIEDRSAVLQRPEYCRFVVDNPAFFHLLKQRITSYWNCYYRSMFPRLTDYPAFQMAACIDEGKKL